MHIGYLVAELNTESKPPSIRGVKVWVPDSLSLLPANYATLLEVGSTGNQGNMFRAMAVVLQRPEFLWAHHYQGIQDFVRKWSGPGPIPVDPLAERTFRFAPGDLPPS